MYLYGKEKLEEDYKINELILDQRPFCKK